MIDDYNILRARVEQAQALAAAATPGPWRSEGDTMTGGMDFRYVMIPLPVGTSVASGIIARCPRFGTHAHEAAANADLMAAAPDMAALVTDLWAEVERLTVTPAILRRAETLGFEPGSGDVLDWALREVDRLQLAVAEFQEWSEAGPYGCPPYSSSLAGYLRQLDASFAAMRDIEDQIRKDRNTAEAERDAAYAEIVKLRAMCSEAAGIGVTRG